MGASFCLVAILVVTYSLMHMIFVGYTKYRIPLDHLLAVYAVWIVMAILDWIRGLNNR